MSLLWLLPIEKIPAKIGGPVLVVFGVIGLLSSPGWGWTMITFGLGVCVYAVIKKRIEQPSESSSSSADTEDSEIK